ncbi:hypothetical protein Ac2012v2_006093 [Leucoagaricus gongylophorus]
MRFATAIASLTCLGLAVAQSNSTNVVTVQVGSTADASGGVFQFIPPSINAANGTIVNFQFSGMPGNHSVTQSTFNDPCTPVNGGFDSGWVFLPSAGLSPVPEWNLTITDDSRPIWFFCKQLLPAPHCIAGMVGAINPPTSGNNTFENFRNQTSQVSSVDQSENGLVGIGASASARPQPLPSGATDFPASAAAAPASTSSPASTASPAPTASTGAAAGLTVQHGLFAVLVGMTVFLA